MLKPDYRAHAAFLQSARQKPAPWLLLAGIVLGIVIYVMAAQSFLYGIYALDPKGAPALYEDLTVGATPLAMYLLLATFGFMILAVAMVVRLLHARTLGSVLGPRARLVPQFIRVTGFLAVLGVVLYVLPPWYGGGDRVANLNFGRWVMLLPLSLLGILIQTSAEEIVFRGYLQQQLAARFRSPLVWMVVPSVVFGMLHYAPETAGENAGMIALWAIFFGVAMADLTARAGTLGPAIAVHFATNVSAILLTSLPDELFGLSLYTLTHSIGDVEQMRAWLPVEFVAMFVMWLTARLAIRR